MRRIAGLVIAAFLGAAPASASPWGEDYFPNVPLVTHEGETVRFFDDLIEGRIVAVNFIYTSCADTCPLETAQLVRTQQILGDRLGKDVFFYSISIDPDHDTPEVLSEYRDRFGARWTFLTGDEQDIIELRRKLGLYVEEIQDGSNNHNVNMVIGNQATGRWMRRSPFENPYVLADQLGNWLDGWKTPIEGDDYANAPKLRSIPRGEQLFRTRCATCHTLSGDEAADALGPDLLGVTQQREPEWLLNWLRAPDQMLAAGDPIATSLYERYNELPMPNMRLNRQEAEDLIEYMDDESSRLPGRWSARSAPQLGVVAVNNAWVRETDRLAKANAGYMTLTNGGSETVTLVQVESKVFEKVEMHEMAMVDGMMSMREITSLEIPANGTAMFKPGGWHLMLRRPHAPLASGQTVEMVLTFASGEQQTVAVNVAAR